MGFLNPLLLLGISAIAVPIIIHLLNRRKFRKITWAAMRFVQLSIDQNQRRMKLEDLILLLLRCAMLALLAFALARPVMRDSSSVIGQTSVTSVLVLDNSFSMGMKDGSTTRFERAKAACSNIVETLPPGSAAAFYLASDKPKPIQANPSSDRLALYESIGAAPLSDRATALFPSVAQAVKKLEGSTSIRREIYVVTDNQEIGWRQSAAMKKLIEEQSKDEGKKIRVHFVIVGGTVSPDNIGITSLSPAEGLVTAGKPVRINMALRNFSGSDRESIEVNLRVGGDETVQERVVVPNLEAGDTQTFPFLITLEKPGLHTVTASIAQGDGDNLVADNSRSIVVNALKKVSVLVINGDPSDEFDRDETKLLEAAMVPAAVGKEAEFYISTVTRQPRDIVGGQIIDWASYRAVVLANVQLAQFPDEFITELASFVGRGNGLLVFPGSKLDREFYNENLHEKLGLLPASFGTAQGDEGQLGIYTSLQDSNYEHPVVEMWNSADSGSLGGRGRGPRFFRRQLLNVPAAVAASRTEVKDGALFAKGDSAPFTGWVVGDEGETAVRYANGEKVELNEEIGLAKTVLAFAEGRHALQEGENLASVADAYGSDAETLAKLNPVETAVGDEVVLPSGSPAIVEHTWGLGRVYQFAYTADTDWSELPASPHSVPLYDKIIGSILLNQDANLNLVAGGSFTRELGPVGANLQAKIVSPGQDLKQAKPVAISNENGLGTLQFDETDRAGVYEVIYEYPEGTEGDVVAPPNVRFATQPDTSESNMTGIASATREELEDVAGIHEWKNADLGPALKKDRIGAEFWLPVILIVLLFAALEIWLAQKFSRPK